MLHLHNPCKGTVSTEDRQLISLFSCSQVGGDSTVSIVSLPLLSHTLASTRIPHIQPPVGQSIVQSISVSLLDGCGLDGRRTGKRKLGRLLTSLVRRTSMTKQRPNGLHQSIQYWSICSVVQHLQYQYVRAAKYEVTSCPRSLLQVTFTKTTTKQETTAWKTLAWLGLTCGFWYLRTVVLDL